MAKKAANSTPKKTSVQKPVFEHAKAVAKYIRISPRKLRLVIDTVRHSPVQRAFRTLMVLRQKGARLTEKVLHSAVANAKNLGMDENRLYISEIRADGGPTMKRFMSRSQGRADRILKRMAHLLVIVKESDRQVHDSQTYQETEKQEGSSNAAKKKTPSKKKAAAAAKA